MIVTLYEWAAVLRVSLLTFSGRLTNRLSHVICG